MTLKENQPRRGALYGKNANPKSGATGRSDGQTHVQKNSEVETDGYPYTKSLAQPAKTGRAVPTQGNVRGYRGNAGSVGTHGAKPTRANDHVGT
jgi:hypothetical protein